jgi:hypothetical protein
MAKIWIRLSPRDSEALKFFCEVHPGLGTTPADVVVAILRGSESFRSILDFYTHEELESDAEDLLKAVENQLSIASA